jgi:protein phosphatase 2C
VIENFNMGYSLYAVFDGHGGSFVADFCKSNMVPFLKREMSQHGPMDMRVVIINAFQKLHDAMPPQSCYMCGTTCTLVLLHKRHMWVANCGDSRAMVGSATQFTSLTRDHKPNDPDEERRINAKGGYVATIAGVPRVIGELAVSRSIGDTRYAPYVIPTPEVIYFPISHDQKYVLLATDGLWDVLSNKEVAEHMAKHSLNPQSQQQLATSVDGLFQEMVKRTGIDDNVTILVVIV